MKKSHLKLLENLYNYIGFNKSKLEKEFKEIPKGNFSFTQFCILKYSNLYEDSTTT